MTDIFTPFEALAAEMRAACTKAGPSDSWTGGYDAAIRGAALALTAAIGIARKQVETREEWGLRLPPEDGGEVELMDSKKSAVKSSEPGDTLVRRTVHTTPRQEVAE